MPSSGAKQNNKNNAAKGMIHSFQWLYDFDWSKLSDSYVPRPSYKMPDAELVRRQRASTQAHIDWLAVLPEDFTAAEASAIWQVNTSTTGCSRIVLLKNVHKVKEKLDPKTKKRIFRDGGRIYERTESFLNSLSCRQDGGDMLLS